MHSFLLLVSVFSLAHGHSWVECTNYNPISFEYETLGNYDKSRCSGYPRGFDRQFSAGFGADTGYNWGHNYCRESFRSEDYTNDIKMAVFAPGQTMYISHPSKNHVAETCTNSFIPSTSFVVKMSSQTDVDAFDISLSMVGGDHENGKIDHKGYQRCFEFCKNMDKSHCLTAWRIPDNVSEGRHSFIWTWEFNAGEYYSNCFDAMISNNPNTLPTPSSTSMMPVPTPSSTSMMPVPTPSSTSMMPVPTPTPSEDFTIETSEPSSTPTFSRSPRTPTPTPTPSDSAEVISSGGSNLVSPLSELTSYVMKVIGGITFNSTMNISIST